MGFIHDKLDIKFLILYLMARVAGPVDFTTLADLTFCDDGVEYFDFAESVAELVSTGHLAVEGDLYTITDKGRRNGEICESSLAFSVRKKCDRNLAKVNAVLRRIGKKETAQTQEVSYENLTINLTNYELKVKGVQVDTPPKEMELIYHLASNPNRVFTRDQLLDEVWGFDYYGDSRTVDVHVKRLREKLEGVSDKWALKTVWGVGYKFEVKD